MGWGSGEDVMFSLFSCLLSPLNIRSFNNQEPRLCLWLRALNESSPQADIYSTTESCGGRVHEVTAR